MVTATPTNIGEVLRQLVDEAISKAAEQPDHLSDFFEQVESDANKIVDTVKRIPDNLVDQLEQPPFRPPDWWSLLVFALLRIRDLLGDNRLTVGYRHPAGWSRMVTLNFSEDAADPDNTVAATLGIALTDPGVTHGLWLQVLKDFDVDLGAGALRVKLKANGAADWKYTIGAAMTAPGTGGAGRRRGAVDTLESGSSPRCRTRRLRDRPAVPATGVGLAHRSAVPDHARAGLTRRRRGPGRQRRRAQVPRGCAQQLHRHRAIARELHTPVDPHRGGQSPVQPRPPRSGLTAGGYR